MATPSYTDNVSIISPTKVSQGSTSRGTLNIQNKFGAYIFCRIGRLSSVAPAVGASVFVRRIGYTGSRDIPHAGALAQFQDSTTAANTTSISASISHPSGTCTLASGTGMGSNQYVVIVDSTTSPTTCEFHHTSKLASTVLTMDRNFANTSISTGYFVLNQALVLPPIYVDGAPNTGDLEVVVDYGSETATSPIIVEVFAQTLDSIA